MRRYMQVLSVNSDAHRSQLNVPDGYRVIQILAIRYPEDRTEDRTQIVKRFTRTFNMLAVHAAMNDRVYCMMCFSFTQSRRFIEIVAHRKSTATAASG